MQFEVLQYRLKSEYNVDIILTMLNFEVARWLKFSDDKKITPADLRGIDRGMFLHDRNENPVLLAENEWALGWIQDNNKNLIMSATPFEGD